MALANTRATSQPEYVMSIVCRELERRGCRVEVARNAQRLSYDLIVNWHGTVQQISILQEHLYRAVATAELVQETVDRILSLFPNADSVNPMRRTRMPEEIGSNVAIMLRGQGLIATSRYRAQSREVVLSVSHPSLAHDIFEYVIDEYRQSRPIQEIAEQASNAFYRASRIEPPDRHATVHQPRIAPSEVRIRELEAALERLEKENETLKAQVEVFAAERNGSGRRIRITRSR